MSAAPDLMGLLSLDPGLSCSPFGGNHRFILIEKDFSNSGDFVFNSLLQHFGRREPNTQILLVTLSHNWLNYSVGAAKCGFNLRRKQNMAGNIDVLSMMDKYLDDISKGANETNYCDYILEQVTKFLDNPNNEPTSGQSIARAAKSSVVMIDDLSILLTIGCSLRDVIRLMLTIDQTLRSKSENLPPGRLNHLIVQTMFTNIRAKQDHCPEDNQLNFLLTNLENICDLHLILKPLETGHSTRVDGTIKFIDNRLPSKQNSSSGDSRPNILSNILSGSSADIGTKKAYFYKLSDRRVRLTSSAFIY
uniref:Elongator complex protein 6 n=1 Tax=Aceria tosichella TaxID=561515 RepID=A0A6G1S6L8_9ACAR